MSCKLAFVDFLSAGVYALYTGLGLTILFVEEGTSSGAGNVDSPCPVVSHGKDDPLSFENGDSEGVIIVFEGAISSGPSSSDPLRSLLEPNV